MEINDPTKVNNSDGSVPRQHKLLLLTISDLIINNVNFNKRNQRLTERDIMNKFDILLKNDNTVCQLLSTTNGLYNKRDLVSIMNKETSKSYVTSAVNNFIQKKEAII